VCNSARAAPNREWLPENPSTFFITKDDSYVFSREGGQVTRLTIRGGGREVVADKTTTPTR
jgi:hypothetical protein